MLRPPERINLAGIDTGRDHLSPSSIDTQLACLQRFKLHYVDRLEPNVKAVPLRMGGAFAYALNRGDPGTGFDRLMTEHAEMVDEYAGNPWVVVPSVQDAEIEATTVLAAADLYLRTYGQHRETREVTFRQRLRNPATGRYSQTFDVLCRVDALSDDSQTIIEDKLVGQIPRRDADQLVKLDRQVSINSYLTWRCTGINPSVKYRHTLKPGIRRRKDEDHDDFLQRIVQEYQDRPDHYTLESDATRTPDDFERLEQELWDWARQRREASNVGIWPRNTKSCDSYGGCRMLPICAREPGAEQGFHVRPEFVDESESKGVADAVTNRTAD
mgnify:CR=1 FL=1